MIDVVTVFHNERNRRQADEMLASLREHETLEFNPIIVDNSVKNRGFAAGCNLGAAQGDGELIAFLNPDLRIEGPVLSLAQAAFTDPKVVITGSRFDKPDSHLREWGCVDWVCGACMIVRRDWFEFVGGFDEAYVWGWEETDLIRRAQRDGAGVRSIRLPVAHDDVAAHDDPDPVDQAYKTKWFDHGKALFHQRWSTPTRQPSRRRFRPTRILPTVSVLVGTYGDASWHDRASRAIASVEKQTTEPLEVIHVHETEGTLAEVRNKAAAKAQGDLLVFLDADDELDTGYIEAMTRAGRRTGCQALLQPATLTVGVDDEPALLPEKPLHEGNFLVIGTAVSRTVFHAAGGFKEWPLYEDWCLWIRCTLMGVTPVAVPDAIYRIHRDQVGRNLPDRATQERYFAEIRDTYFPAA